MFLGIPNFGIAQKNEDSKYPDIVVEAYYSGYFDVLDSLYGGQGLNYPIMIDVNKILGPNKQKWFVSLPKESYLILQYTDNEIIDAPNQPDIQLLEHGCCNEWADIYVSNEGFEFTYLGRVDDCNQMQLDLADIGYKKPVRFVKVVGLDVKCASPGYDLVSIYGLPNANRSLYAGMDDVETYFDKEKTDKILILENVYFDTDKYDILAEGINDLEIVIAQLKANPEIRITISGHTDSVAGDAYNMRLSLRRAEAVTVYLIEKGISPSRIHSEGFGESIPLRSNATEEGRAINRRVELRRMN